MSYEKLIHEYLDGEAIGHTQEEVLFNVLASDDELRGEFKRQVTIHNLAQKELNSIAPPAHLTSAVFSNLGFTIPTSSFENIAGFLPFIQKNAVLLLLFLFGLSLAGISYFAFENAELKNDLSATSKFEKESKSVNINIPVSDASSASEISLTKDESKNIEESQFYSDNEQAYSSNLISTTKKSAVSIQSNFLSKNSSLNSLDNFESSQKSFFPLESIYLLSESQIKSLSNILFDELKLNISNGISETDLTEGNYSNYSSNHFKGINIDNTKWKLLFRRLSPFRYSADDISARYDNPINNMSLAIFRKINDYHSFGFEVGSEQFSQVFTTKNDNISFTQYQNPMLIWAGISYSFTPVDYLIPYELYPYAQFSASGTSIGPILRGQIGLNWRVQGNFNIIVGYDYGNLLYNVDGNIHNSAKSGIIIGAGLKF